MRTFNLANAIHQRDGKQLWLLLRIYALVLIILSFSTYTLHLFLQHEIARLQNLSTIKKTAVLAVVEENTTAVLWRLLSTFTSALCLQKVSFDQSGLALQIHADDPVKFNDFYNRLQEKFSAMQVSHYQVNAGEYKLKLLVQAEE